MQSARFSPAGSRIVSAYYTMSQFRDYIMSRLWLNLGGIALFSNFRLTISPRHKRQSLEQMHILFVLQQRAMQGGQSVFALATQIRRRQVFGQQKLEPIQHLGGRGFLLQPWCLADLKELCQRRRQQVGFNLGEMYPHDGGQNLGFRKADIVEKTAAKNASGRSFSLFDVIITTGRCAARMVWPVS